MPHWERPRLLGALPLAPSPYKSYMSTQLHIALSPSCLAKPSLLLYSSTAWLLLPKDQIYIDTDTKPGGSALVDNTSSIQEDEWSTWKLEKLVHVNASRFVHWLISDIIDIIQQLRLQKEKDIQTKINRAGALGFLNEGYLDYRLKDPPRKSNNIMGTLTSGV